LAGLGGGGGSSVPGVDGSDDSSPAGSDNDGRGSAVADFDGSGHESSVTGLDSSGTDSALADLDASAAFLAARAADQPGNFRHLQRLIEAERAWAIGDFAAAATAYDAAVTDAAGAARAWHAALIAERAGIFFRAYGMEHVARQMLAEAFRGYGAWRAHGKVRQMLRDHPFLAATAQSPATTAGTTIRTSHSVNLSTEVIDLLAVLEAARALSSETDLDRLRRRVGQVLSAMTGATAVRVVLHDDETGGWMLPADAATSSSGAPASATAAAPIAAPVPIALPVPTAASASTAASAPTSGAAGATTAADAAISVGSVASVGDPIAASAPTAGSVGVASAVSGAPASVAGPVAPSVPIEGSADAAIAASSRLAAAAGAGSGQPALTVAEAGERGLLPLTAFRYAERTREPMLVDDASRDDRVARDPYFAGVEHCSLLVVPVLSHGVPRAMLVLENRLTRRAFSMARLDAVLLIAGQLTVSLENARLYASLERKVAERTEELAEANRRLELMTLTDPLTGLANRRKLTETLAAEWQRALRSGEPVAVAMIDIDNFKKYNDHYGHQGGDECLRRVAHAVRGSVRTTDLVARYGGEEFCIVMPGTHAAGAMVVAERARRAVADLREPHALADTGIVTISLGVTSGAPVTGIQPDHLIKVADEVLYEAKRAGRNRVAAG